MIATRYTIKQMIRYHLLNTGRFEGTGLFCPIGLFSQHDASAARPAIGSAPGAAGPAFPEDGPPPPLPGVRLRAPIPILAIQPRGWFMGRERFASPWGGGAGCKVRRVHPRPSRGRGKSFIVFGKGRVKRTPSSLRLRLSLLGDLLWIGAHALSRAPTSALSGKVF